MQSGTGVHERAAAQAAALRGASLAFENGKPPRGPKPKPKPNIGVGIGNYSLDDGALAAASKVGASTHFSKGLPASGEELRLASQNTGSSAGGSYTGGSVQHRLNQLRMSGNGLLQPPGGDRTTSASFIAATLAARRSPSLSPNPTGQQGEIKKLSTRPPSIQSENWSSDTVDSTPVLPTKGLIGMFEGNHGQATLLPLRNIHTGPNSALTMEQAPPRAPSRAQTLRPYSPDKHPSTMKKVRKEPPKPPKPEIRAPKPNISVRRKEHSPPQSRPLNMPPSERKPPTTSMRPVSIPITSKASYRDLPADDSASSVDSFVSASSQHTEPSPPSGNKPSFRAALAERRRLTSNSTTSLPSATATIDSMANAIVASSLASSRAASPSKTQSDPNRYPPLPPPRKTGRNHIFHSKSRSTSPAKPTGMKTTLRKVKSQDSLDEGEKRRGKKSLVKKHPHKHHEGDRKRWRDSITERERKRYEAVWASNRGLWLRDEDFDRVCSLVVRDIWSRSRLNPDILEEVYALVDREGRGSLGRDEFVVGLWLVDQRLRGRKLPMRVGESVWRSVGGTGGIKIHGPKMKK